MKPKSFNKVHNHAEHYMKVKAQRTRLQQFPTLLFWWAGYESRIPFESATYSAPVTGQFRNLFLNLFERKKQMFQRIFPISHSRNTRLQIFLTQRRCQDKKFCSSLFCYIESWISIASSTVETTESRMDSFVPISWNSITAPCFATWSIDWTERCQYCRSPDVATSFSFIFPTGLRACATVDAAASMECISSFVHNEPEYIPSERRKKLQETHLRLIPARPCSPVSVCLRS